VLPVDVDDGVLHNLQVAPALRQVRHLAADGSLVSSGMANAISIQLAGSWLPLEDMAGGAQDNQWVAICCSLTDVSAASAALCPVCTVLCRSRMILE
jgi:hypothetical protein